MTRFEISGIADHGNFTEEGQIELTLLTGEEEVSLWMPLKTLQDLAVRTAELFLAARTGIGTKFDPLSTTAVPTAGIKAERAIGLGMVILSIRDGVGLVHRFALHPEQSAQLRPQLRRAEIEAKSEEKTTRQ